MSDKSAADDSLHANLKLYEFKSRIDGCQQRLTILAYCAPLAIIGYIVYLCVDSLAGKSTHLTVEVWAFAAIGFAGGFSVSWLINAISNRAVIKYYKYLEKSSGEVHRGRFMLETADGEGE